jgi:hypothetical protein
VYQLDLLALFVFTVDALDHLSGGSGASRSATSATAVSLSVGIASLYVSSVIETLECPRISETTFGCGRFAGRERYALIASLLA